MDPFGTRLERTLKKAPAPLCIGLDPHPGRLPDGVGRGIDGVRTFLREVVAATADLTAAYKANLAFYEALGPEGWALLEEVRSWLPPGVLWIGDGKRGDIGSTSAAYLRSALELGFDAVTVHPYLGRDGVEPFLERPELGVFVLARTSNPGAAELQELPVALGPGRQVPLYVAVALLVRDRWNAAGNVGLVVGATDLTALEALRHLCPHLPFLVPGLGAQGGDPARARRAAGRRALFVAARSILYASPGPDFAEAARREAERLATILAEAGP